MVLLVTVPAYAASSPGIVIEDIRVTQVDSADADFAWFLVGCTVRNSTPDSGTVSVVLRTVDHWGYERKSLGLSGYVRAGESARFSVLHFMERKMFQSLRRYEVKSVTLH